STALEEIIALDPNLPELVELSASYDKLRRDATTTRRGPWVAAAASFGVVLFGATSVKESRPLASVQTTGFSTLIDAPRPLPIVAALIVEAGVAAPPRGQAELERRVVSLEKRQPPAALAPRVRPNGAPIVPRAPGATSPESVPPPPPAVVTAAAP